MPTSLPQPGYVKVNHCQIKWHSSLDLRTEAHLATPTITSPELTLYIVAVTWSNNYFRIIDIMVTGTEFTVLDPSPIVAVPKPT